MRKTVKRIAMIGHKFIPSRDGGVEVVVSSLAPQLAEPGYDVTCYNRTNRALKKQRKSAPLAKTYRGVRLIWTPTLDRRGLAAMSSSIIASVMAAFGRYDLVHYHTEGPCVLCGLPRLLGKKIVVTILSSFLSDFSTGCLPQAVMQVRAIARTSTSEIYFFMSEPPFSYNKN